MSESIIDLMQRMQHTPFKDPVLGVMTKHPSLRSVCAARAAIMEHRVSTRKETSAIWQRVPHTETVLTPGKWAIRVQHGDHVDIADIQVS